MQICPSGPTCCTRTVEERLGAWSEKQYRDAVFNKTVAMAASMDGRATQVDGELQNIVKLYCAVTRISLGKIKGNQKIG